MWNSWFYVSEILNRIFIQVEYRKGKSNEKRKKKITRWFREPVTEKFETKPKNNKCWTCVREIKSSAKIMNQSERRG